MKEKKNIDRLYQEKFKDFEVTPDPEIWKNIADRLENDKRRKTLILPIWYKIAGAAAVLAILLTGGYFLNQNNFFGNNPGVVLEFEEIKGPYINITFENTTLTETEKLLEEIVSNNQNSSYPGNGLTSGDSSFASSEHKPQKATASKEGIQQKEGNKENSAVAETKRTSEENNGNSFIKSEVFPQYEKDDSEDLIAEKSEKENRNDKDSIAETAIADLEKESIENSSEESELEKESKSKLSFSTFAAPVVYNNFGSGNAIDPQFSANPSSSNLTMAYGVNVAYQVAEKLKLRTGIGKVAMSYDIQDVMFSAAINPNAIASIDYSPEGNNFQIQGQSNRDSYSTVESSFAPQSASRSRLGELNQQFGYIEIPLELEYQIIDKKLGLNIIGGGSSLILDENKLFLNSNNQSATLGKANNINDLSFSTNIGLGIDYNVSERIQLNLEPIFKYQINTFNDTQNLQPYYFGVYSGLSYKF